MKQASTTQVFSLYIHVNTCQLKVQIFQVIFKHNIYHCNYAAASLRYAYFCNKTYNYLNFRLKAKLFFFSFMNDIHVLA